MARWLALLRRLSGADSAAQIYRAERRALEDASAEITIDPRLRAQLAGLAHERDAIHLGALASEPALPVRLAVEDLVGHGHTLVVGGSGAGKTCAITAAQADLIARFARHPDRLGVWSVDLKGGDQAARLREEVGTLADRLPPREARALIDRYVVLDPFSDRALVPLQILLPEEGTAPEVQAFEVTSALGRLAGDAFGVLQENFAYHLVLLGITRRISLPELTALLGDPAALIAAAALSPHPEVRAFFSGRARLTAIALEGVRARLARLLRLPRTRLQLGASSCMSFRDDLASKLVIADFGRPPLGCEDIARFWSSIFTLRFARAAMARTAEEARRPVLVAIDEWQEGLLGGRDAADQYERLLAMSRARGISLLLCSQSLAGAAKVSATLPKVVATNTNVQLLFRPSIEDARLMAHVLPITGRRRRPAPAPWEERARTPFMTASEEREARIAELAALPDRHFYLWLRRRAQSAVLVRARDLMMEPASFRPAWIADRLEVGTSAVPIEELEREVATRRATPPEHTAIAEPAPERDVAPTLPITRLGPTRRPRRRR